MHAGQLIDSGFFTWRTWVGNLRVDAGKRIQLPESCI